MPKKKCIYIYIVHFLTVMSQKRGKFMLQLYKFLELQNIPGRQAQQEKVTTFLLLTYSNKKAFPLSIFLVNDHYYTTY